MFIHIYHRYAIIKNEQIPILTKLEPVSDLKEWNYLLNNEFVVDESDSLFHCQVFYEPSHTFIS